MKSSPSAWCLSVCPWTGFREVFKRFHGTV